jgi:hypothetical protein
MNNMISKYIEQFIEEEVLSENYKSKINVYIPTESKQEKYIKLGKFILCGSICNKL